MTALIARLAEKIQGEPKLDPTLVARIDRLAQELMTPAPDKTEGKARVFH